MNAMRIFISHAANDEDFARKLGSQLSALGFEVWDPSEQLLPGDNWALKIGEALEESRTMIVLLSPDSMKSDWVRREIQYALGDRNYEGRVFPVMVRPTEEVPWILHKFHMLRTNNPAKISKRIASTSRQEA